MKKRFTSLFLTAIFLMGFASVNAQTVLFHETFNNLTPANTTKNALTGSLVDESGYTVGGGGSAMLCSEDGSMELTGGRFQTKNLDLSGDDVVLYVTYKLKGATTKKFQIDIDKTGTSGLGGILNEAGGSSPTVFETKSFPITGGTSSSYIHFRTESDHTIVIDEIKIVKGTAPAAPAITSFVVAETTAAIDDEAGTITAELPVGTELTALTPVVGINSASHHYTPAGAQDFTNPVTYTVYNESESESKAYQVTLTVAVSLSTDATLSDLKYKGATITGFAAATREYSIELPYGSTVPEIAEIAATPTHERATVGTITRSAESFPTDITVPVTAEDGQTALNYIIHFTEKAPATDATLKTLTVNGAAVTLVAGTYAYVVDVPHNTTTVPAVAATANDSKATVVVTPAESLEGSTSIDVTAEDGTTKLQYTVSFNVLAPPTKPVTTWNFSDWDAGTYAGVTVAGLTITGKADDDTGSEVTIDANNKSIDGFSFTQRLKLGGGGAPDEGSYLPTVRFCSFQTQGDAKITIYGMSSSGGAQRTLVVTDGTQQIGTFVDDQAANTIKKGVIEYTGGEATIYLYSASSGFNIYAIVVEGDWVSSISQVNNDKPVRTIEYFDILGKKVTNNYTGLQIVKTIYTDGTSSVQKIYRLNK